MVGLAAGILSNIRTPMYQATARVLLRPSDPAEVLNPANAARLGNDPDRYVEGQKNIIQSEDVARQAIKDLPGLSIQNVEDSLSVSQGGQSDVLKIAATDPDPTQASEIANAVANGYIENRRAEAVSGLQRVADDIDTKLGPILARIGALDDQIAALDAAAGGTASLQAPVGIPDPSKQLPQLAQGAGAGGQPTTQESIKAARYAAAVQYEQLYGRQQELLIDIGLKRGEAELIAKAKTPVSPISPRPKRDIALGVFVGLLLGGGVSLLREQLDDRVRSAREVEQLTGLPLLAQLPFDEETAKSRVGVALSDRPNSPLGEAIRSLRTSIQYLGVDRPVKVIMVTSAVPGEGKSLVSANLAAAFAQADFQTVLISADLRRSTINELFGKHKVRPGLTGVVMSAPSTTVPTNGHQNGATTNGIEVPILGALVKTPILKLWLLPSGAAPPNPAELLGSKRMDFVLAKYAAFADIVIIDTPPLLPVTDAAVLAAKCDGVVLVTAVNETRRDAVERAKVILQGTGARLLGTVINKSPTSGSGSYYYAGYYEAGDEMMQGGRGKGRKKNRKGADARPAPRALEPTSGASQEVSS